MKFTLIALFVAIFGMVSAHPGLIKNKLKEVAENPDYKPISFIGRTVQKMNKPMDEFEPETLIGKVIKRADALEHDKNYEPITLIGKTRKHMEKFWTDDNEEAKTEEGKAIKELIRMKENPDYEPITAVGKRLKQLKKLADGTANGEYNPKTLVGQALKDLQENPDTYQPKTIVGKLAVRKDQMHSNPDYEPISFVGKKQKELKDAATKRYNEQQEEDSN